MNILKTLFIYTFFSIHTVIAAPINILCNYDKFASIKSVDNVVEIFQLNFTVDKETSKAKVLRKNSISDVQLYPTGGGFTFVEINKRGNVLTTTVDIHGKSVHSRNTIIDGELVPSQFYGVCDYK